MSHVDAGPLAAYNSLMDPHLAGYFSNSRMKRHLVSSGLVSRKGHIVSENTYRLNMARKEHKKHVRDLLAQAIVHKTLDMERTRQVEIKQKLEEIAKIELVKRVKSERGRQGDEDILPYLEKSPKGKNGTRPKSASAAQGRRSKSGDRGKGEESRPRRSRPQSGSSVGSGRPRSGRRRVRARSAKYPRGEVDDRHLYSLDQHALHEYTMGQYNMDSTRGPSPYTHNQYPPEMMPTPPPSGTPRSAHGRSGNRNNKTRQSQSPDGTKGHLMLHRMEPAMKHQERVQTMCDITMHYFGKNIHLDYERFDPRDEVMIEQQHCGGNTLTVFRENILPGSNFTFTSRRHRGYPFSLTFYVNSIQYCRLSTCCEYKHPTQSRIGGSQGFFCVEGVEGAAPCYKCQVKDNSKKKQKKKKQDKQDEKYDDEDDEDEEENEEEGEDEDEDDTNRLLQTDPGVTVEVEDEEEEEEEEDHYSDDDFDEGENRPSSQSSSRSSHSEKSQHSSGAKSSDSSRSDRSSASSKSSRDSRRSSESSVKSGASRHGDDSDRSYDDRDEGNDAVSPRGGSSGDDENKANARDGNVSAIEGPSTKDDRKPDYDTDFEDEASSVKSDKSEKSNSGDGTWSVDVYTSNKKLAGTDANVRLVAYGRNDDGDVLASNVVELDNSGDNFEKGVADNFKVEITDFGKPFKIRVWQDGSGALPGWHLEKIIMEHRASGKKYTFRCDRWLSADEDDGATMREIPAEGDKSAILTKYKVKVFTGDLSGAGTDAKVFMNIYGDESDSGDRTLVKSQTNRNKFERGKVDDFSIEAVGLGKITKIKIGHDGGKPGAGWYLDKVIVTSDKDSERTTFGCKRWLDAKEDDGKIVRELSPSEGNWSVKVFTSNVRNAGTDAGVHLVAFGKNAKGETVMSNQVDLDNCGNNFERGQTDEFNVDMTDFGKPFKIRIWQDGSGPAAGWHLERVEMIDSVNKKKYTFTCNRWLDESEDDGATMREIPADGSKEKLIKYTVSVVTGDLSGAGTDATVFVNISGEESDSGDRTLSKSLNNRNKFERGKMDDFSMEAVGIGKINKVRIGHDGTGAGDGWFLNKVIVKSDDDPEGTTFGCNRWLDVREDDGEIVRELFPVEGNWQVKVFTSNLRNAGTDASVRMVVFGKNDEGERIVSNQVDLDNCGNNFEKGQMDKFNLDLTDFGKPYKIRVWQDGSGPASGWHLEKVEMEDVVNNKKYTFRCNRWLAENEEDGATMREIPEDNSDEKSVRYTVDTHTGDKWGAGTDANVFITIYGENGDSGDRQLTKSINSNNKFEKGKTDKFSLDAVGLGAVQKIRIGHDGDSHGDGWYLDKVVVTPSNKAKGVTFKCNDWLDIGEGDGLIVRELHPSENDSDVEKVDQPKKATVTFSEEEQPGTSQVVKYNISVKTGNVWASGTDADVFINIFGESGNTGDIPLATSQNNRNKFERGKVDEFTIESKDLGQIKKIKVGHDGDTPGDGWFLEKVMITSDTDPNGVTFGCNRWLDVQEDDGVIIRELFPSDGTWKVSVHTSDIRNAGTNSNVYLVAYGRDEDGKSIVSNKIQLDKSGDDFEQGKCDTFDIEMADIGKPYKIRMWHDGSGTSAGWHLEKVELEHGSTGQKYTFNCNKWLDENEDDGATIREIPATGGDIDQPEKLEKYAIDVHTGSNWGAGTDATVFINIFGEHGDSGNRDLIKSQTNTNKFERGKMDQFIVESVGLGKIQKIRIGHDGDSAGDGWFLDKVVITPWNTQEQFNFECHRWLDKKEDDGKIVRELRPSAQRESDQKHAQENSSKNPATAEQNPEIREQGQFESANHSHKPAEGPSHGRQDTDDDSVKKRKVSRKRRVKKQRKKRPALTATSSSSSLASSSSASSSSMTPSSSSSSSSTLRSTSGEDKEERASSPKHVSPARAGSPKADNTEPQPVPEVTEKEEVKVKQNNDTSQGQQQKERKGRRRGKENSPSSSSTSSSDSEDRSRHSTSASTKHRASPPQKNSSPSPGTSGIQKRKDEEKQGKKAQTESAVSEAPRAAHLSRIGVTPGKQHSGSVRSLLGGDSKKDLELIDVDLTKDQVSELIELIQDRGFVESLVLRNTGLDDNDVEKLAAVLATTPPADLQMLNLNSNSISASGAHHIVSILKNKPNLQLLLLHNSPLGDLGIHILVQGLLEVNKSPGSDTHIQEAARGIVSNVIHNAIESSMTGSADTKSRSSSSEDSEEAQNLVAQYESQYQDSGLTPEHLDISDCQLSNRGMEVVADLLRANTKLDTLCLTGNKGVGSKGWRALGESLRVNTKLKSLALDYSVLGDEGVTAFIEGVRGNKTLSSLDLEGNKIGDIGGKHILELVQECPNLSDVTLMPGNHISDTLLDNIQQVLSSRK